MALVLPSCGGSERAAEPTPSPTPTAVVTAAPATATPTTIYEPPPEETPTPASSLKKPDEGGDEAGISVPVKVRVTEGRTFANKEVVPAFLNLRFTVVNRVPRRIEVVVIRSGAGGGTVGRVSIKPGRTGVIAVKGLKPGSLEVASPDLDPDQTAIIAVEPGAAP